jgi:hypothetical protein
MEGPGGEHKGEGVRRTERCWAGEPFGKGGGDVKLSNFTGREPGDLRALGIMMRQLLDSLGRKEGAESNGTQSQEDRRHGVRGLEVTAGENHTEGG